MVKLMPGYVEDVAAWQARLEDLAAKGWFYVPSWRFFFLASFEWRLPKTVRYRLEPAGKKGEVPDQERRETYRSLGWEYVDTIGKTMHLWRCDDPEAPELHTDPETEARAYDQLSRQEKISRYLGWGILAVFVGLIAFTLYFSGETYLAHLVGSWLPLWYLAASVGFFWAVGKMARWQTCVLRQALRTMRAGVEAPRRRPYRLACFLALVIDLLWVLYIIAAWCHGAHTGRRTFQQMEDVFEPVPYVAVSQNGEAWASPQENWLTSEQWWTVEDDGNPRYLVGEAQYYRLRFPSLADNLVKGVLAEYEELGWPITEMQYSGLDEAWAGETEGGYRYLVLRLGDQVWDAGMHTERPLEELLGQYAAAMAEARQG